MNSRRQFFKHVAGFVGIAAVASVFSSKGQAEEKRRSRGKDAGGGDELAVPGKDIAGTLGYMEKSKDPAKHCANCSFFTAAGKKGGADVGKCQLMAGKLVKAEGYCNSWAKKA